MTNEKYILNRSMRVGTLSALIAVSTWLGGCASSLTPAPVSDRTVRQGTSTPAPSSSAGTTTTTSTNPAAPVGATGTLLGSATGPFADKAGQPGYYIVKPGDTVMRVSLETGQYWRDVVRWNSMENPNVLEVGQVLRVAPPPGEPMTKPVAPPNKVDGKPLAGASGPTNGAGGTGTTLPAGTATPGVVITPAPTPITTATTAPPAPSTAPATPTTAANAAGEAADEEELAWIWPAAGSVVANFDEKRNRGIDIAGKAGDPVHAAADGRVILANAQLRGYGNLVIIRHNNTYISAYAHNSKLLVKEGDVVRKNQRIAEMGNTDADRTKLHFEIRRVGRAIDPMKVLPSK